MKYIRNLSREIINTVFKGKPVVILPKGTLTLQEGTDDEKEKFLLETYGFLRTETKEPEEEKVIVKPERKARSTKSRKK